MIIGFVGLIGSGKGTAGDFLEKKDFIKESFGKSVKDIASVMFNFPRELLEGDTKESRDYRETPNQFWTDRFDYEFTPRMALQLIGTEVGRNIFHSDFWIHCLETRLQPNKNYVITDVRFRNEIEWIRNQNGVVINIIRGELPEWYDIAIARNKLKSIGMSSDYIQYELENKHGVHASEYEHVGIEVDSTIFNDGTPKDLENEIVKVLNLAGYVI